MVWRPSDTCGSSSNGSVEQSTNGPVVLCTISDASEGTVDFRTVKELRESMKKPVKVSLKAGSSCRHCGPLSKSRF